MSAEDTSADRIEALDALRGFALLGIVVVNAGNFFASGYTLLGESDPRFAGPADEAARFLVALLLESKFFLLFSFLFGYGFWLQMAAAERAQAGFRARYLRRLLGLGVLGLLHAVLLFPGDILLPYALLGLLLLAARGLTATGAVAWATALVLVCALPWAVFGAVELALPPIDPVVIGAMAAATEQAYRAGAASVIVQRVSDWSGPMLFTLLFVQAPMSFAMFLFGLAAGRAGLVARVAAGEVHLWKVVAVGLAVGLPGAWTYAVGMAASSPAEAQFGALAVDLVTAPFLACAYAALLMLALRRRPMPRLAAAGRMALSNYLLQSVVLAFLFTGYGLGWMGQRSPVQVVGLALALYVLQVGASAAWMRRHAHGPVEWALRALTHGRWPRWRT